MSLLYLTERVLYRRNSTFYNYLPSRVPIKRSLQSRNVTTTKIILRLWQVNVGTPTIPSTRLIDVGDVGTLPETNWVTGSKKTDDGGVFVERLIRSTGFSHTRGKISVSPRRKGPWGNHWRENRKGAGPCVVGGPVDSPSTRNMTTGLWMRHGSKYPRSSLDSGQGWKFQDYYIDPFFCV